MACAECEIFHLNNAILYNHYDSYVKVTRDNPMTISEYLEIIVWSGGSIVYVEVKTSERERGSLLPCNNFGTQLLLFPEGQLTAFTDQTLGIVPIVDYCILAFRLTSISSKMSDVNKVLPCMLHKEMVKHREYNMVKVKVTMQDRTLCKRTLPHFSGDKGVKGCLHV